MKRKYLRNKMSGSFKRLPDFFYERVVGIFDRGRFEKICRNWKTYPIPFALTVVNMLFLLVRYIYCIYWVRGDVLLINPVYIAAFSVIPFIFWMMSTICQKFEAYGIKRALLWMCIANALLTIMQLPFKGIYVFFVYRYALLIKVAGSMTQMMVVNLARILLLSAIVVPSLIILIPLSKVLSDSNAKKMIGSFKLSSVVDLRKDRNTAYDVRIMKEAEGLGKKAVLHQHDLYTHMLLVGPSGTGKTSTSIMPMIIDILDKKCRNRKIRQEKLKELLDEGKAYIKKNASDPGEYDIEPVMGHEDEFYEVYRKYPDAGITCVSPNDSIGDHIVKLCRSCDVDVQMVDPEKHYDDEVVRHMGLNPFYVPPGLSDVQRTVRIVTNARNFSEILISVNEASGAGGGDQYFRDLNTSVTTNIAGVVMAYKSLTGSQALLGDVKDCINDFSQLYIMALYINDVLDLGLQIMDPKDASKKPTYKKEKVQDAEIDLSKVLEAAKRLGEDNEAGLGDPGAGKSGKKPAFAGLDSYKRPIKDMVRYVNDELFMNGDKMYDQSRGLRNIMNEMVSHPDVYDILNAAEEHIDFDRNMSECRVTVVDTAVQLGKKASSALGLFYLLNLNDATQRRRRDDDHPRETQIHFLITDESAQYTHGWMSQAVNLFRQYHVACLLAFQSLSQMDANANYKDIKGSLLQVGNMITYGRLGEDEMKTFEILAGEKRIKEYQENSSHSSLLESDPNASAGERVMDSTEAVASKTDLRYKNFREATWFRYVDGDVLPPINVVLEFADLSFFEKKGYKAVDFAIDDAEEEPEGENNATNYDECFFI